MIVANWKMNGTQAAVMAWLDAVASASPRCEWVFCPPSVYLTIAAERLGKPDLKNKKVTLGAQNCHMAPNGAFTGEISAAMLKDAGCRYVILGHSERRQLFQESNNMIAEKVQTAQRLGLVPILCVGETAEQREANQTQAVILTQLNALASDSIKNLIIAYEPLWAIGTGVTATPLQAQAVHQQIRQWFIQHGGKPEALRILYGGSVNPSNAADLLAQKDINGLLVGGASLKAVDFMAIGEGFGS
jgi:triosephosphate isomerase (TIM)